jgi:hypothetical protein
MPLAFETLSHGSVAFGFFNIESDVLLLDTYFFFADDFCRNIEKMTGFPSNQPCEDIWPIYHIADPQQIGDLHGAIHGVRYTGFIGEVYRHFPFPELAADFKQKPDGRRSRSIVEEIIREFAQSIEIKILVAADNEVINIGAYRFSRTVFHALINYVWRGGYPRWKDELRPASVLSMQKMLSRNPVGIFDGIEMYFLGQREMPGGGVVGH